MEDICKKPSAFLHLTESIRSFFETIRGLIHYIFTPKTPVSNGQIVLVVPGLLSSDISTSILRWYLEKKGFIVYGWGMGTNFGRMKNLPDLTQKIEHLTKIHHQKIILIGWSMGGLFARELCHQNPEYIKKLITMGSPFSYVEGPNHAKWIYELLNKNSSIDKKSSERLAQKPPVPSLAIYSKLDGIVPWNACMEINEDENHKNLEVRSSHFGMGANPAIMKAIYQEIK